MKSAPSVVNGFRLTARIHFLVVGVWLVSVVLFIPAQMIVQATAGPARANLPAGGLDASDDLIVFVEIMRLVAVPLSVAIAFGCLLFIGWWILWHAGTARWWMDPETDTLRFAQILGLGLSAWWRYARLALFAIILQLFSAVGPWLPFVVAEIEQRFLLPLLIFGCVMTVLATFLVWLATLRGAWLLGDPIRRSAVAAWVRGLSSVLRQPLSSILPIVVWAVPGFTLLILPLIYDGPAAAVFLLVAWLLSSFCWVALHLSYAPTKPKARPKVSPLEPPGVPYVTTRFPTLHNNH